MTSPSLECPAPILRPGAQGISRVAVDDANAQLTVTFYRPVAAELLNPRNYTLTGGQRLFPHVLRADLAAPAVVRLALDQEGDFSIYTLTANAPDIDPFFASHKLRFRLGCDDPFDCRPPAAAPPPSPEIPVSIDYLAKDYSSFRQALLDFIPSRMPAWTERSEADIGMMLVELFSATADSLSYMQDRVGNEAFLDTATQRRSVAGHLALIGYTMDDGNSARTWLQFQVNTPQALAVNSALQVSNDPKSSTEPLVIFETGSAARLFPKHNAMQLFAWGNTGCCLPAAAATAALAGGFDDLAAGDYLLFDDGKGHRDIVQLTEQPQITMSGSSPPTPVTLVTWSRATPLHYDYCADSTTVRGNLVLATNGETVTEDLRDLTPEQKAAVEAEVAARKPGQRVPRQRLTLSNAPLAMVDGASTLQLSVDGVPWQQKPTLLESGPNDTVYRVEIDDRGDATVVFGDGRFGLRPAETSRVTATYRVGGGSAGNVGADTLTLARTPAPWLDAVTNPLPATGGRDLESRDHARRFAPQTFKTPQIAVTAEDYQAAARAYRDASGQSPIQRASAAFRWTGSWLTVLLAVDPAGSEGLDAQLRRNLLAYLDGKRLAGYDLDVIRPVYLPVELDLEFCLKPGFLAGDVEQSLQKAFHDFFSPDNFSFGEKLYISRIYAAAMSVPGVASAHITVLARLHAPRPDRQTAINLRRGYLAVGPDQIVRLDNDRNFPENGVLRVAAGVGA